MRFLTAYSDASLTGNVVGISSIVLRDNKKILVHDMKSMLLTSNNSTDAELEGICLSLELIIKTLKREKINNYPTRRKTSPFRGGYKALS